MFKLIFVNDINLVKIITRLAFFLLLVICFSYAVYSENYVPKTNINGSGLKIPRIVSLKNSLTYMRSGPGKKYPIIYEIKKKGYPIKIVAEFNNKFSIFAGAILSPPALTIISFFLSVIFR